MNHANGLAVGCTAGVHRFDETQVIGMLCQVWPQITDPGTAFAVLSEFPRGVEDATVFWVVLQVVFECDVQSVQTLEWQILDVLLLQHRLCIERFDLRNPTVH